MAQPELHARWHIAADGTVIQSYSEDGDLSRRKYVRFATARPLELSDLTALDERIDRFRTRTDRLSWVLLVGAVAGVVLVLLGWLVLPLLGVESGLPLVLVVVGAVLAAVGVLATAIGPRLMRSHLDGLFGQAGIRDSAGQVMRAAEARTLIEAPGAVSEPPPSDSA